MPRLAQVTGGGGVLGGVAWVLACLTLASLPRGCVDEECLTRPMRDWSVLATTLVLVAAVLVGASGAGMMALAARRRALGRLGAAALAAAGLGIALFVVGGVLAAAGVPWMDDAMPAFVVAGLALVALAILLAAFVVGRAALVPRWAMWTLAATALLLLAANEQTGAVLFALPFGCAWACVSGLVLRSAGTTTSRREPAGRQLT